MRDDYYKDMKPLDAHAVGYIQNIFMEDPDAFEASVWVNDTWYSDDPDEQRRTIISIEGHCGDYDFGFELTKEACLLLSDIIWSELFKRGVTSR